MVTHDLPHIVCCLTRPEVQRALRVSLARVATVTFLSDRRALRTAAGHSAAVLVLAEVVDSLGSRLSAVLIQEWRDTLDVPIVGLVRGVSEEVRLVAAAVRAGLDDIIIFGIDDVAERVAQLLKSREATEARAVHEVLGDEVDPGTLGLIETCVRETHQVSAHALARAAGVSERTLTRRFALVGLPAPGTILRWVRVLLTLKELQHARRSVALAARQFGYSSNTAFRTTLRQLTDMSPSEAREPQGYQRALAAFRSTLRRARQGSSPPAHRDPRRAPDPPSGGASRAPVP